MGATVEWLDKRKVKISTKALDPTKIKKEIVSRFRGSVLLLGPLLARFGKVSLPKPGGDIIGARPIDTHLDAFSQLGVKVLASNGKIVLEKPAQLANTNVILNEFSVTATENMLLFAALQPDTITIKTSDQDYPVQELAKVLAHMGVKITLAGFHVIRVHGKRELRGMKHSLMFDPIEAGTFLVLAAAARGSVVVKNVEIRFLELFLKKLKQFGVPLQVISEHDGLADIKVSPWKKIKIDQIQTFIYPGIHTDLQSPLGVLATQAKGSTLLHDPLYPGRLKYLEELNKMGAEIYIADPHRAIINGPTKLFGTDLGTFDLRGGAAMIIAALIAKGESRINNIYQVDRGYERIEERLQKLGADIKRINS
jgi:UDP-N-acetylglucosamine 1-carboxyvinyltransferase